MSELDHSGILQTELHRHLDASIRKATLFELAKKFGIETQSTSLQEFEKKWLVFSPLSDLREILARLEICQRVLRSPEILRRVAYETVEDCKNEGTQWVELRFSPSFSCEKSGLQWQECLDSFHDGIQDAQKDFPEISAGLICIASRDYGIDSVGQTVEFALRNQKKLIGFDLAGNEVGFPNRNYAPSFKKLQRAGIPITVHAGEACGPESVWEAIDDLGACRIGHGIASVHDPKLMKTLEEKRICLEVCPTSNWLTQAVSSIAEHPLPKLLRAGVPVSVNTDDPGVMGNVTLPGEFKKCADEMKMAPKELLACRSWAWKSRFFKN